MSRTLIAGAILGAGLVSGGMLIQSGTWSEAAAATPRLLEQVMARLSRDYIDTVSLDAMYRNAASGLVKELDEPYSVLLTPDRFRRLRESASGRYAGVGIEIDMREGFVTIIAPLAGTPAARAGIEPGDRIMQVDGKPTHGLTMEEVQQVLRGPTGTKVKLGIARGELDTAFTLTRRDIVFHPVQRAEIMTGRVGYIELATFSEHAAREVRRAVDSLRRRGATSLILDLRKNPGGLFEQGIAVADLFLDPNQTIVSIRGRTADANREFDDGEKQLWPDLPIVALIDSGTASAAEIVAGALQDHDRAVLVGTPTYGKGSAQSLFPVTGGGALKLTTARWFTPDGRTIERDSTTGGIAPDMTVRRVEGGVRSEEGGGKREEARQSPPSSLLSPHSDPVIRRAIQLLAGIRSPAELRARVPRRKD
jgi:carboxyl-terminal processing protease